VCTQNVCPTCSAQSCPSELCLIEQKLGADERKFFQSLVDTRNTLSVSLVNYEFRNLTANWLCHAKKLNFKTYLFLAEDKQMYDWLKNQEGLERKMTLTNTAEPVFLLEDKHSKEFNYYQREYHEIMNARTKFVLKLLLSNIGVLIFDVDAVWLSVNDFNWLCVTIKGPLSLYLRGQPKFRYGRSK
jgi:hypothetical protein